MYRGGPGGEACEDERKLKNVTETVYDACHGLFFLLSCQETVFPCPVRSNEMSGSMHRSTEAK